MWEIKKPTIHKTRLDFTSSGQGFYEVSQLVSDEVEIMNAIELMDFDEDKIQVLICDHCGATHCKSGDWINLRLSGNFILMIPAFDEMEDNWSKTEYSPPRYYGKEGTPYFSLETYKSLQSQNSLFPKIENIKLLQAWEAMRLAQLYMPIKLFGEPGEIKLNLEKVRNIVASSENVPKEWIKKIEGILLQNYENKSHANLRHKKTDEEIIYLFIDDVEFNDWQILVKDNSETRLLLEETFIIEISDNL